MKSMGEHGEHLIKEAWDLSQEIAAMRRRLTKVEDELDKYFPKASPVEAISCATGSAHRVIHEEIFIDPARLDEAKDMLGDTFPKYFTSVTMCRPTPAGLSKLGSADSRLGEDMRGFLTIRRERFYSFSPGRRIIDVEIGGRG